MWVKTSQEEPELAGETGDLPAHGLAHAKKGTNGLLQQAMLANGLFGPAVEDLATRFANDKTKVLEQAADLVFKIALDLDQLSTVER